MRLDARNFSLRAKLVAVVSGLLALVAVFLLAFTWPRLDAVAGLWMERHATAMASTLAAAVSAGVEFDDAATVHESLARLESTPDAAYAEVQKKDGTRFARWSRASAKDVAAPAVVEGSLKQGGFLHSRISVKTHDAVVGTLTVGFSLEELHREERANLLFALILSLGIFGVGSAVAFALGTLLARPIRDVTKVALQLARGEIGLAEQALGGPEALSRLLAGEAHVKDEASRLAIAFARMLGTLKQTAGALQSSSRRLSLSVDALLSSTAEQKQTVTSQADAIQRTAAMAQQFKVTSQLASDQAGSVLEVAARAQELGRAGEQSISRTAQGLNEIRRQVEEIARRIGELSTGSVRIALIADTVKDLADQSTVVALNAGIEAARAGEGGRAFAVVARELRTLADQSGDGAEKVRAVLAEFTQTMRAAVQITEEGSQRIEDGLGQVGSSEQKLRELSGAVTDSSKAAREIATAVDQQHQAIGHLFEATTSLATMMDDTLKRLELTNRTAAEVEEVSRVVSQVAQRFRS